VPEFANNRPIYDALLDHDRQKKAEIELQQEIPAEIRGLS
jgi:hypothetical protein